MGIYIFAYIFIYSIQFNLVKNLVVLLPQCELPAVSLVAGQDTTTCQSSATTYAHTESMSTHSFTQAWAHRHTDCAYISSILPLRVAPNNLASHAHVILPSHIVFLHLNTLPVLYNINSSTVTYITVTSTLYIIHTPLSRQPHKRYYKLKMGLAG